MERPITFGSGERIDDVATPVMGVGEWLLLDVLLCYCVCCCWMCCCVLLCVLCVFLSKNE